jgi:hypothetical protein
MNFYGERKKSDSFKGRNVVSNLIATAVAAGV